MDLIPVKVGIATEDDPKINIPSLVGKPKPGRAEDLKGIYFEHDVLARRDLLKVSYPIKNRVITSWENMEMLWDYCFSQLHVNPKEHPVLLTEAPCNPKESREKMAHVMFETFGVSSLHINIPPLLSLYASGRMDGLVIDSGESKTDFVQISNGYALRDSIMTLDFGGNDVTNVLLKSLNVFGLTFHTIAETQFVTDMKERHAYIALDFDRESKISHQEDHDIDYTLPDGHVIRLGHQRFRCAETLFEPFICGEDLPGIHKMAFDSINGCHLDLMKELYSNILLSGGTTMFKGISERLTKELKTLAPSLVEINVIAPEERIFSAWRGGSILSRLDSFQSQLITKAEFEEVGVNIVHKKCS